MKRKFIVIGMLAFVSVFFAVFGLSMQSVQAQTSSAAVQSAAAVQAAARGKSLFPADFYHVQVRNTNQTIGSPHNEAGRKGGEPVRQVRLTRNYYIGKYPVTLWEYDRVMTDAVSRDLIGLPKYSSHFRTGSSTIGLHPVESITWWHAIAYCNERSRLDRLTPAYTIRLTRNSRGNLTDINVTWNKSANGWRLPTEAEWEIAARAGTRTAYSFGSSLTARQANFGSRRTTEVGSFPANAWGIHDMHGNVWEWCWDWFESYVDSRGVDRTFSGVMTDPSGPSRKPDANHTAMDGFAIANLRVIKGGSWNEQAEDTRSARRAGMWESYHADDMMATPLFVGFMPSNGVIGFRIVRNAP